MCWKFPSVERVGIPRKRVQQLRAYSKWTWHVDEAFRKINGERHYLWRALDHEGEVLESGVTKRRNKQAALKFLRKLMKRHGRTEEIVTDRFPSYRAALRELGSVDRQTTGRWLNNRVENSHLPFRRRDRAMQRFRRMRSLQKFAAIHSSVFNRFNQERSLNSRDHFKANFMSEFYKLFHQSCPFNGPQAAAGFPARDLVEASMTGRSSPFHRTVTTVHSAC
jgi:putative transposase